MNSSAYRIDGAKTTINDELQDSSHCDNISEITKINGRSANSDSNPEYNLNLCKIATICCTEIKYTVPVKQSQRIVSIIFIQDW